MKPQGIYTKEVMKHFKKPHNMGMIKNPDGVGKVGNPLCGDVMWLYIKVKKGKDGKTRIKNIKFQTFGCVAAIATSSKITELAKGKTLEEALNIDRKDIVKSLGGLPVPKIHCSLLASDALAEAIYDYYKKNKISIPKKLQKIHERLQKVLKDIEERHKHVKA
jgi:nitrogen fixation NifU-like protein